MESNNDVTSSIEEMLLEDKVIKQAIEKTKKDDTIVQPLVTKFLSEIMENVEDPDKEFDIKHGFLTLGKTINYLSQALCKDYDHFQKELTAAHKVIVDTMMVSISPETDEEGTIIPESFDEENFSLRRLMMMAGSLVDYVYWRESLNQSSKKNDNE